MKKLILTLALIIATVTAFANPVRYFTRPQAIRVANALDAQNELMIYCGFEYELATYVIVNQVWMEPVNSKYYEIWLYGYDAYTGEEIYMPLDLSCVWLYNHYGNRIYSAAQYLRFRSTVATPNFYWTMPPYNPFVRHYHDPHFNRMYTYHYEVHRYGWRPPSYHHGMHPPLPPYYMRTPSTPAPVPMHPFTPGVNHPVYDNGHSYLGTTRTSSNNRSTSFNNVGGERTDNNRSNAGNPGTTNRNNNNSNGTSSRNVNSNNGRDNNSVGTRDNNSNNNGTNTRGNNNVGTRGNNTNNNGTSTRDNNNAGNRGNNNVGTRGNTNTNNGTNTRGTTTNSNSNTRGTTTNNNSNTRGTTTNNNSNTRGTTTNNNSTNTRGTTGNRSNNSSSSNDRNGNTYSGSTSTR